MAKDPAFLFYHHDFLVGTTFMTFEEKGAYITILCHLADKGSITEENIVKVIPAPIWHSICCKFQKDEKGYYNDRLRKEIEKRRLFTESRRNNLHMGSHKAKHMKKHMENRNRDININKDKDIKDTLYIGQKHFYLKYEEILKKPYVPDYGKDGAIFKGLRAILPDDKIVNLIDLFFQSNDDFIKKAGFTVGVFKTQVNKLEKKPMSELEKFEVKR